MPKAFSVVIFFMLLGFSVFAQVYSKTHEVSSTITFKSAQKDSKAKQVILALTSAFNLSTNGFKIKPEGTLVLKVDRSSQGKQYFLKHSFQRKKISGDNFIKGFRADSILWPDILISKVQIYNGRHLRDEIVLTSRTDGTMGTLDISEFVDGRIGEFSMRVVESDFDFDDEQVGVSEAWIAQVRAYFSFAGMLNDANARFKTYSTDNSRDKSSLLIDWFELERMLWLLGQQNFPEKMHLVKNDPAGFMPLSERLSRYIQRARTLFDQTLAEPLLNGDVFVNQFSKGYVAISTDYLSIAAQLQPADAIAPMLMAEVPQIAQEKQNFQLVLDYFSKNHPENQQLIPQKISNGFVAASQLFIEAEEFSNALLLLNNAAFFQSTFHLNSGKDFEEQFLMAFEGVATSFLKVSRMAATLNKHQLASVYLQRAMSMLEYNQLSLNNIPPHDSSMPSFFEEVIQVSRLPEMQLASSDKLDFMETVHPLVLQLGANRLSEFNLAYGLCVQQLFAEKLRVAQELLVRKQYPDAAMALTEVGDFYKKYENYLVHNITEMQELSKELFQVYLIQSDQLLRGGQPGIALEQLVMARNLGQWLPDSATLLVDNRMDQVVIPLIDDEIKKTRYDIWALHLEAATSRLQKIDSIEQRYLDGKYPDILLLIRQVRGELSERGCVAAQQKLDNSVNEILAALRNHAYKAAINAYETAESRSKSEISCGLNLTNFLVAQEACRPLLVYLEEMKEVKSLLFDQGYSAAIDRYVLLRQFVSENQLDTLGIQMPALYTFVGEQRLPLLTITSAGYYAEKGQYDESLQYMWLAKYQKIDKSELRSVMRQLASGLASRDKEINIPVDEAIENYTSNDQYFSYFKFVYKKNRLL